MQAPSPRAAFAPRVSNAVWSWNRRYWRFVVIAMLALLHVAALRGTADVWARALLLAHLGLFLLWQPVLRSEHRVSLTQAAVIALGATAVLLRLDGWLLAFWVVVLAGLVGGRVFQHGARWQARYYLLVLAYLLALLVVVILPEVAPRREISPEVRRYAEWGLPLVFVVLAAIPVETEAGEAPQVIDFFYSIFLMLVLSMIVHGSFTLMTLGRTGYLEALTTTVFLIAGSIFLVGFAWNPGTGYAGLNVFFSRYLFSIGLPVEKWLHVLAELSQTETRPERFLAEAVAALARLPWVAGAAWRADGASGESGGRSPYAVEYERGGLSLTVYSRYRTSSALQWHLMLLGQLLAEFHAAKLRERQLLHKSYLEAVHETGARVTHDVKNLLQSLNVLCAMAGAEGGDSQRLLELMRGQLPAISQRLAATLERLRRPELETVQQVTLAEWWESQLRQYQGQDVEFHAERLDPAIRVPRALFDGVLGNLLQNALAKRAAGAPLRVRVALECDGSARLRVCDNGRAVPAEIARELLRGPVASATGLGIGLYQAARHAEASGYRLELESNRDGEVCFALRPAAAAQGSTPAEIRRE